MHMTDSLGRFWQLGTVQLDYNLPERFGLAYIGADNAEHRPAMIHRALFGSFERFIGILLEHLGGELPVWLAPVQAIVLPITDHQNDAAAAVVTRSRRPACAASSTTARSRSDARSATPNCARSSTCWSWASARQGGTVSVRERGAGDTGVSRHGVRRAARSGDRERSRCAGRACRAPRQSTCAPLYSRILAIAPHAMPRRRPA